MSSNLYDNANVMANVVSTVSAVMAQVSGNEIADLSSLGDPSVLPNLIAAKLQNTVAPLLVVVPSTNS